MAARLLLDENLSQRLLALINNLFPGSTHIRTLGQQGASDNTVWTIARNGGFVLVTRDEDFVDMSVLRGAPPKVSGSMLAMLVIPLSPRCYELAPSK